ncbi:MAG: hypothetical protein K8T91_22255 [Planctomycetes bacterium]|nr:hypothetical protein [Planctomycetota bacterium]
MRRLGLKLILALYCFVALQLTSQSAERGSSTPGGRTGDLPVEIAIDRWPADGRLPRSDIPKFDVGRAYLRTAEGELPVIVTFNQHATESHFVRPSSVVASGPAIIVVEPIDSAAGQYRDGRIVLSAGNAQVQGETAKLESHPGNLRIGLWRNPKDFVTWDYKATRPGRYDVYLTYSCAEKAGTKINVEIGKEQLDGTLKTTDNGWYGYTWQKLGNVAIPAAGPLKISVRCREMVGGAVMNLKAVTLIPAGEGTLPVQAADGTVTLHAKDVTIHGVQVQYEPKPEKNTVGFWTHATDTVSWEFSISKAGKFDVQILQGCGKGQGGSKAVIEVAGQELPVTVEDTGHFQNFKPRIVGAITLDKPGKYVLKVVPTHKAGVAVMDLRELRLLPK